ncbi:MAG: hypothetical protein NT169_02660 [Chloroflexi bacterium]|nr:hypothetical protein [Chloroflexota bacterium]
MTPDGNFPEPNCKHISASVDKDPFTARMRFHQSWYRRTVLNLDPGPNPHARGELYGNMLCAQDGDEGKNFLSPEIFAHAKDRFPPSLGSISTGRLYNNLLGSQTMCFNLFGPLKDNDFATRLVRRLPGIPQDVVVTDLLFEYAPERAVHLRDATSFDAFVAYRRPNGLWGFIGIETKLTEPFSQDSYDFADRYARWTGGERWWWKSGAEVSFKDKSYNQLWRNQLLVYAMLNQPSPQFTEGYCAVVFPLGDAACKKAIATYRHLLLPSGARTLLEWPLEVIVERWNPALDSDAQRQWFNDFQTRYLRLEASEAAWRAFQRSLT